MKKSIVISISKSFYLRISRNSRNVKALNTLARFQLEYDKEKPVSYAVLAGVMENSTCRELMQKCWNACNPQHSCTWRQGPCRSCPSRNYDNAAYLWRQMMQEVQEKE